MFISENYILYCCIYFVCLFLCRHLCARAPQPLVGHAPSQARVTICWSAGTSCLKRPAAPPSCLGAAGATGITLIPRNTASLSAAARVSRRTEKRPKLGLSPSLRSLTALILFLEYSHFPFGLDQSEDWQGGGITYVMNFIGSNNELVLCTIWGFNAFCNRFPLRGLIWIQEY